MFGGMFGTPRLSPALAAALVIATIGITVAVMSFLNSPGSNREVASNNSNREGDIAARGADNANAGSSNDAAQTQSNDTARPPVVAGKESENVTRGTAPGEKPRSEPAAQRQLVAKKAPQKVTPEQLVREAQQKYVAAIAILSRDVNHRRSQIDPTVLAQFDTALATIDRTIEETRRAVREHPDDPVALQYLLAAYSKKVDVLRDMAAEGQ
jgi:hypothetical protein